MIISFIFFNVHLCSDVRLIANFVLTEIALKKTCCMFGNSKLFCRFYLVILSLKKKKEKKSSVQTSGELSTGGGGGWGIIPNFGF